MFEIIFYTNTSEPNRIDKTNYLTEDFRVSGVLRNSTSLIVPIIEIEKQDVILSNYCYISAFRRYYYITNIFSNSSNIWEIHLTVDCLMSFKENIYELDVVCDRQEFNKGVPNGRVLEDDLLPASLDVDLRKYNATGNNLFISQNTYLNNMPYNFKCFSVSTAGWATDGGPSHSYWRIPSTINSGFFSTYGISPIILRHFFDYLNDSTFLSDYSKLYNEPNEAILSLTFLPFNMDEAANNTEYMTVNNNLDTMQLALSKYNYKLTYGGMSIPEDVWGDRISKYTGIGGFKLPRLSIIIPGGDKYSGEKYFLNYPPYTKYTLYVPYYGFIDIDSYVLAEVSGIFLDYYIGFDGVGCCEITIGSLDKMIVPIQVGYQIPLTRTNRNEMMRSMLATGVSIVAGAVTAGVGGAIMAGATSAVTSIKSKSTPMTVDNARSIWATEDIGKVRASSEKKSAALNTVNIITQGTAKIISNSSIKVSKGSVDGGSLSKYNLDTNPYLLVQRHNIPNINNYAHQVGLPSLYSGRLGDLSGYTKVSSVHLDGISGATDNELIDIENILKGGFVI